ADQVGRPAVIKAARDLGIVSPLADTPSLALGTSGVTLLELTSAYAAVAGNNLPVRAYGLPKEQQGWIAALWNRPKRLSGKERDMLLDLLSATVERGTGRGARLAVASFGKTGTTQDARDAIFVGFAGDLVVGVWVGRDDNQPMPGLAGGGVPARVWRDFMSQAIPGAAIRVPEPVEEPEPITIDQNGISGTVDLGPVQFGVATDGEGVSITARPGDPNRPPPPESRAPPPEEPNPDDEPPQF
ncbi:MAG: penicillin-binding protein, partial [Proteobacteria bacterium]|nr:penicillin-binding protein [Pseudomonadota bacterium]